MPGGGAWCTAPGTHREPVHALCWCECLNLWNTPNATHHKALADEAWRRRHNRDAPNPTTPHPPLPTTPPTLTPSNHPPPPHTPTRTCWNSVSASRPHFWHTPRSSSNSCCRMAPPLRRRLYSSAQAVEHRHVAAAPAGNSAPAPAPPPAPLPLPPPLPPPVEDCRRGSRTTHGTPGTSGLLHWAHAARPSSADAVVGVAYRCTLPVTLLRSSADSGVLSAWWVGALSRCVQGSECVSVCEKVRVCVCVRVWGGVGVGVGVHGCWQCKAPHLSN